MPLKDLRMSAKTEVAVSKYIEIIGRLPPKTCAGREETAKSRDKVIDKEQGPDKLLPCQPSPERGKSATLYHAFVAQSRRCRGVRGVSTSAVGIVRPAPGQPSQSSFSPPDSRFFFGGPPKLATAARDTFAVVRRGLEQ